MPQLTTTAMQTGEKTSDLRGTREEAKKKKKSPERRTPPRKGKKFQTKHKPNGRIEMSNRREIKSTACREYSYILLDEWFEEGNRKEKCKIECPWQLGDNLVMEK